MGQGYIASDLEVNSSDSLTFSYYATLLVKTILKLRMTSKHLWSCIEMTFEYQEEFTKQQLLKRRPSFFQIAFLCWLSDTFAVSKSQCSKLSLILTKTGLLVLGFRPRKCCC